MIELVIIGIGVLVFIVPCIPTLWDEAQEYDMDDIMSIVG